MSKIFTLDPLHGAAEACVTFFEEPAMRNDDRWVKFSGSGQGGSSGGHGGGNSGSGGQSGGKGGSSGGGTGTRGK
jgi:hypothetical protein